MRNKFIPNFEMILNNLVIIWSQMNLTLFAALYKMKLQNLFSFANYGCDSLSMVSSIKQNVVIM
jgi:hypothetical protein